MYDEGADAQMEELYRGRFGSRRASSHGQTDWSVGPQATLLPDDQMPDDVMPKMTRAANLGALRVGHGLARLPVPPPSSRTHGSKFVFRDISGPRPDAARRNPALTADFSGAVRLATNKEVLYRSWTPRYWSVDKMRGRDGLPYADAEEDKPASFHLPP